MPEIKYNDSYPRFDEYVEAHINDYGIKRSLINPWVFLADGEPAFIIQGNLVIMLDSKFEKPVTNLAILFEKEHYTYLRHDNRDYMVHITCNYHRV